MSGNRALIPVNVVFRIEYGDVVVAIFPMMLAPNGRDMLCYRKDGKRAGITLEEYRLTRDAMLQHYEPLMNMLCAPPHNYRLKIHRRMTTAMLRQFRDKVAANV